MDCECEGVAGIGGDCDFEGEWKGGREGLKGEACKMSVGCER